MMSVEEDKAFEDQIERMKQKNQHILEKFQASEEDRKRAENYGATITKDQNISIRLKPEEITRLRNNKPNAPRPKSFHGNAYHEDHSQISYNQFNDNRRQGKLRNNKFNDEEVAYQDYMHFQQAYSKNNFNNYNRSFRRQNSNPGYVDDQNIDKPAHQDFNRFNNPIVRNRNPQKFAQNNFHNTKISKENDFHNSNSKTTKENDFHSQNFQNLKISKDNDFHTQNHQYTKPSKENDFYHYKNSSQNAKEPFQKPNRFNANQSSKRFSKPKGKVNSNKPVVNGSGDSNSEAKKKSTAFDDEYIDDTLEDLEQYRLKVDMEDFIVIDPESPDPILAMPLKPWTNDDSLLEMDSTKSDGESKHTEYSSHLLNHANERAKEYLNLVNQNHIEHNFNNEINSQSKLNQTKSTDINKTSESTDSTVDKCSSQIKLTDKDTSIKEEHAPVEKLEKSEPDLEQIGDKTETKTIIQEPANESITNAEDISKSISDLLENFVKTELENHEHLTIENNDKNTHNLVSEVIEKHTANQEQEVVIENSAEKTDEIPEQENQ